MSPIIYNIAKANMGLTNLGYAVFYTGETPNSLNGYWTTTPWNTGAIGLTNSSLRLGSLLSPYSTNYLIFETWYKFESYAKADLYSTGTILTYMDETQSGLRLDFSGWTEPRTYKAIIYKNNSAVYVQESYPNYGGTPFYRPAPDTNWHHLVLIMNKTNNTILVYNDGSYVGSFAGIPSNFSVSMKNLRLINDNSTGGARIHTTTCFYNHLNVNVPARYSQGPSVYPDNATGILKFAEGSGTATKVEKPS